MGSSELWLVFSGVPDPSESEVQAEALGALLRHLDLGPTVIAGGSGGARISLIAAARNPDVTTGLAMWWISGGVPGLLQLANYYCMPSIDAAWHGGMDAVVQLDQWQEVLERNPGTARASSRSTDKSSSTCWTVGWSRTALATMRSYRDSVTPTWLASTSRFFVFRSGASDMSHTHATSQSLAAGLPGAELVEPPWGDDEWNERRAEIEQVGSLFVRWPLLVPSCSPGPDRKMVTEEPS